MYAKDVMTANVLTVDPDDEVRDVAQRLLDRHVSGAPVVDQSGRVVGIVSEGDLMRRAEGSGRRSWWLTLVADKTAEFTRTLGTRARDVMTREVVSVEEETPISEIARILETSRIKRAPVLRDGRLVGIVSRADLLRALVAVVPPSGMFSSADDRKIRAEILKLLGQEASASLHAVSVIVVNGVVYLWGIADTQTDKDAIRVAAENVVGTQRVHDFVNTLREILGTV